MCTHAAPWLAWSLVTLSVVLLVGRALVRSDDPVERSRASRLLRLGHAVRPGARLLGGRRHYRLPPAPQRHRLDLRRRGRHDRLQLLRGGLRRVLARERFGPGEPRRDGGVVLLVVVDSSGIPTHELLVAAVPRWTATLAALAACGLVRHTRDHRLPRGLHAGAGTTRRLPTDHEPLRCRQPYPGGGCGRRCHSGFSFYGGLRHLADRQDAPGGEGT